MQSQHPRVPHQQLTHDCSGIAPDVLAEPVEVLQVQLHRNTDKKKKNTTQTIPLYNEEGSNDKGLGRGQFTHYQTKTINKLKKDQEDNLSTSKNTVRHNPSLLLPI